MENNANYAIVGALGTAVLVALFAFVYWFAGPASNTSTKAYDVVFTGPVSGIGRGTDVLFNGIKVGQVNTVALDPNDTNRVVARVEVDATAPVKADSRVLMGFQGLTGVGSLQFSGGTEQAGEPVAAPDSAVPVLYAEASNFQSILDGLSTTVNGAATAVDRINSILDTNDTRLNTAMANVETFTNALAANSEGVESFLATVSEAGEAIAPLAEEITTLSSDLRGLIDAVPPDTVAQAVTDVSTFTQSLARNSGEIDKLFATTSKLADNLTGLTDGLSASVEVIDRVAAQIDPEVVGRVLTNVDTFSTRLNSLTTDLQGLVAAVPAEDLARTMTNVASFTDTLSRNSGKVDELLADASAAADNLNTLTDGLSGSVAVINQVTAEVDPKLIARVLANVDTFSTDINALSTDLRGLVAAVPPEEVSRTLTNVATLTDTLSRNSGQIDAFFAGTSGLSENLNALIAGLTDSVAVIDKVTAQIDPEAVGRVIGNIDDFSASLGSNAGNVDTIVANVSTVSENLIASVDRINAILEQVDGSVSGADGQGLFAEIGAAATSVRQLADQLNASTARIAVGLSDFTSGGLSEYSALAVDARSTLQRLDRVVRNLENNPQGLIFGGETVRDYNKQ
ncbi:MlaD family protein [uncultured Devosia sp.]|uniref:MlaD family protein n=1 Tax=uncultured Devosia sp. TaxID=211434 RepID=UPI0035CC18A0